MARGRSPGATVKRAGDKQSRIKDLEIKQRTLVGIGGKSPRDPPDTASAIAQRAQVEPALN